MSEFVVVGKPVLESKTTDPWIISSQMLPDSLLSSSGSP